MKTYLGWTGLLVLSCWGVAWGGQPYDVWNRPARYAFTYRLEAAQLKETKAERLRIWLPYPAETDDQKILSAEVTSPWAHQVKGDAFGNRMVHLEGNGVPASDTVMPFVVVKASLEFERLAPVSAS